MNKKAIELSINFIVITVLSLIVLGIGFYLVTNIFSTATKYKGELDEQTQESLLATLRKSGDLISMPIIHYSIARGATDVLGAALLNDIGIAETFYITTTCTEAVDSDENDLCAEVQGISCETETAGYCSDWITLDTEKTTLENRKDAAIGMFVMVPDDAPSGTFGYSFKVCTGNFCGDSGSEQYGPTKKLYITVPE